MNHSGWTEHEGALERSFRFKDFGQAFAFMTRVAMLAEQHRHHPTWTNTYAQVHIRLTTHDAGNVVTEKDRRMAAAINGLLEP